MKRRFFHVLWVVATFISIGMFAIAQNTLFASSGAAEFALWLGIILIPMIIVGALQYIFDPAGLRPGADD